jgi:hypothetical protein
MGSGSERGSSAAARLRRADLLVAVALSGLLALLPNSSARAAFGFKDVSQALVEEDSAPALQAGSHPYAWTAAFALNTSGSGSEEKPDGALKDLRIELPPGLVGAPALLPHCSRAEFAAESCPGSAEVGAIELDTELTRGLQFTVYNLEALAGNAAELGFVSQQLPVTIALRIAPRPPYNLIAELPDAPQAAAFFGATLTIRGVPGGAPFLTLPRSCAPASGGFEADSWEAPGVWAGAMIPEPLQPTGCAKLGFNPTVSARPTATAAHAPTGLEVGLDLPNPGLVSPTGTASADLAGIALDLPAGMTINPAAAANLAACSPAQLAAETADAAPGEGCPQAAGIGSAEVTTPLLERPLAGAVYVATPDDPITAAPGAENSLDARYALYLVLRDAARGVLLTIPIRLDADPSDGRLTATAPALPQLPITHLELRFNSGPRAPLTTPPGCGSHSISYSLTPSSGNSAVEGEETFATTSGCEAGFAPDLSAGTTSNAAGSAAPLVVDLGNGAGGPNLGSFHLALPPGLTANLAAVATCPEAAVAAAACPPASRLGYVRIAVGSGAEPLKVPAGSRTDSDVFLAGRYLGAPFSLLVSVRAAAGPFDLGPVVLRAPVRIDPETGGLSVAVPELPQIRGGVPLRYRTIRLVLDRPGFVRNPTSCEPAAFELRATAADGAAAAASTPFQAADCAALGFAPRLSLRLSGGLGRNGHPRVEARLASRPGEANLAAASVDLPAGELLDTRHLRALCARDLPPGRCPAASRLGWATVRSPLLPEPLRGPIFLRAPSHRYPDLVAAVSAGDLRLHLHGRTGSTRSGRLRIRLVGLPDLPLSGAKVTLAGGRRGIVVNSASLCGRPRRAVARLDAHNGRHRLLRPQLRIDGRC